MAAMAMAKWIFIGDCYGLVRCEKCEKCEMVFCADFADWGVDRAQHVAPLQGRVGSAGDRLGETRGAMGFYGRVSDPPYRSL